MRAANVSTCLEPLLPHTSSNDPDWSPTVSAREEAVSFAQNTAQGTHQNVLLRAVAIRCTLTFLKRDSAVTMAGEKA